METKRDGQREKDTEGRGRQRETDTERELMRLPLSVSSPPQITKEAQEFYPFAIPRMEKSIGGSLQIQIQKDPVRSSGPASFRIKPEAGFDRSNRKLFVSSMAASKV